jgi:hypothetical protein
MERGAILARRRALIQGAAVQKGGLMTMLNSVIAREPSIDSLISGEQEKSVQP